MKDLYEELVELLNLGARNGGFKDAGELWTSGYDMPVNDFKDMIEEIWQQVLPLYEQLHCYTKYKLQEKYGKGVVSLKDGLFPAHITGNMWSQGDLVSYLRLGRDL